MTEVGLLRVGCHCWLAQQCEVGTRVKSRTLLQETPGSSNDTQLTTLHSSIEKFIEAISVLSQSTRLCVANSKAAFLKVRRTLCKELDEQILQVWLRLIRNTERKAIRLNQYTT
ncbi:MAG: hypothetical protein ACRCT8_15850 [Lacipirellulaceae bacterium]